VTLVIRKQLKSALFRSIESRLSVYGFTLKTSKDSLVHRGEDTTDIFQLVCLDGKPSLDVQPNVAIRNERVERIFHKISGFDVKNQSTTPTVGGAIGVLLTEDARSCEFYLESETEIMIVTDAIVQVFENFALPYIKKYGSIHEIDLELNSNPHERSPHRAAPWLRCSTGIIVAKLVGRSNFDQLSEIYSGIMINSANGFYFRKFNALLEVLQSIDVMGNGQ